MGFWAQQYKNQKMRVIDWGWFVNLENEVQFKLVVEMTEGAPVDVPKIDDVVDELPKHKTEVYETRPITDITGLIIHHTAIESHVGPQRIAEYHVENMGWPGIGYHFVIDPDGVIYLTNRLETVSYQAKGVNEDTVGIGFQGNFQTEIPTEAQVQAGAHLCAWLIQVLGLEMDDIKGHKELMATACPGNQWLKGQKWKEWLFREIVQVQEDAKTQGGTEDQE